MLNVNSSGFFLRDLDPNANFLESQEYFSTQDFSSFTEEELFNGMVTINDQQIVIEPVDDPDTEEDESAGNVERIEPGIRVPLDPTFFQQNILDKEGNTELLSEANLREFFRGIHLSVSDDIMILLDLANPSAGIIINYEYDKEEEGSTVKEEGEYTFRLLTGGEPLQNGGRAPIQGNAVNTFINEAYPAGVLDQLNTGTNASRIYLKGGAGTFAEIKLFDQNNGEDIINQIKANNWIINEANLVFYVDREIVPDNTQEPPRLYLYNAETNQPIYDPATEISSANTAFGLFLNYDGFLEELDGKGIKYTIRVTNHINDLVIRDEDNATLALTTTPDIRITNISNSILSNDVEKEISIPSVLSPFGTVLFGSNVSSEEESKKLQLEIFYTEAN